MRARLGLALGLVALVALLLVFWGWGSGSEAEAPTIAATPRPAPAAPVAPAAPTARPGRHSPAPPASDPPAAAEPLSWREVEAALDAGRNVAWDQRSLAEWSAQASALADLLSRTDALPEAEARAATLLDLALELGRAADNANRPVSPGFGRVAGRAVNVGHYRAAQLLVAHPDLMALDEVPTVARYAADLASGTLQDVAPGAIEPIPGG